MAHRCGVRAWPAASPTAKTSGIGGAQRRIERQRAGIGLGAANPRRLEIEIGEAGRPAGGNENMRGVEGERFVADADDNADAHAAGLHRDDRGAFMDDDALVSDAAEGDFGEFGVVLAQRLPGFDDGHVAAEPAIAQRHLEAHRAGADNHQMAELAGVVEDGLGGEIGHRIEPRHVGQDRIGAGGDDEAAGADVGFPCAHGPRIGEQRGAAHQLDAARDEPCGAAFGRGIGNNFGDMVADLAETDLGRLGKYPEFGGGAGNIGAFGRGGEGAQRQSAGFEAGSAGFGLFDQNHAGAEPFGGFGNGDAGRTATDDAQIGGQKRCQAKPLLPQKEGPPCF